MDGGTIKAQEDQGASGQGENLGQICEGETRDTTEVGRRRGRKQFGSSVSFFFTNFPDDWDAQALWRMFLRWGKATHVYLPPNRDRYGRRYGFVRFMKEGDHAGLERRLQQIWIGTYKLIRVHLSVPKVEAKKKILRREPSNMTATYADVLAGKSQRTAQQWRPKKYAQLDI